MIQGIDVSHWQNDKSTPQKMNFAKSVARGAKFAFMKVSERGGIDQDFLDNWKNAKGAGLLRGGYHFLRWDLSGLLQARIFCEILKDDPGELPPVADFEAPIKDGKYPSNALLEQFLLEVEAILGIRPMIYTSPGFWKSYGRNKDTKQFETKWAVYPLWVAHYMKTYLPGVSKPDEMYPWKSLGKTWTFWQYTATGDGIAYGAESKGIDLNWFNGSLDDLFKFANKATGFPIPGETPDPGVPPVVIDPGVVLDIDGLKDGINKTIDAWVEKM